MRTWEERARSARCSREDPRSPRLLDDRLAECFDLDGAVTRPASRSTRSTAGRADVSRSALPHHYTGKVRDLYEVDLDRMLIVASDRISVFDVVLPDEIPDKGRVLTALSTFWFEQTAGTCGRTSGVVGPHRLPRDGRARGRGRAMLVRAATRPVRLECIARGYLFGSAWAEYEAAGTG